jgi:hypothetical protein
VALESDTPGIYLINTRVGALIIPQAAAVSTDETDLAGCAITFHVMN